MRIRRIHATFKHFISCFSNVLVQRNLGIWHKSSS